MGRRARIEFAAVKSSLVNLPLSLYGPLVERQVRPQQLAVHLVLVDTPQIDGQTRKKAEAYVGWTGMPAASSLANYGGKSVGGELETIEVDPLFADVVGLKRSDVVEIGLVYDMVKASRVHAEPLAADDWDVIELHAAQLEYTLLSQARVASAGQSLVAWVHGRTPVKLRIVSLEVAGKPSKSSALLSTDTEFVVAPKTRKSQTVAVPTSVTTSEPPAAPRMLLRVVASPIEHEDDGNQLIRAYVSRIAFAKLAGSALSDLTISEPTTEATADESERGKMNVLTELHSRPCAIKRIRPPLDPTAPAETIQPERQDPLSLALAQRAAEETQTKEQKPEIQLTCIPDAQVHYTTFDADEDTNTQSFRQTLEMAHVEEGSVAFSRSLLGEGTSLGFNIGDIVLVTMEPGSPTVQKTSQSVLVANDTTLTKNIPLAGVTEELDGGHRYLLSRFMLDAREKRAVRGANGLLILGNAGAGKTSLANGIAQMLHTDLRSHAYVHQVDCSKLATKPVSTLKSLFQYWFDLAAFHSPTALLLDNLDKLLPSEQEQAPSYRSRQLAALFIMVFGSQTRAISIDARGIAIIATAKSSNSLHPSLRASHLFGKEIKVGRMTKDSRRDVLALVIKQRVDASETTLIADDLNLNAISSTTEGYAPADLKDLVSRAIHQAAMRVNKTLADGPTKLSLADFEKAKEGFIPASLRDVPLQKSEVVWSDIGGLLEPRRILRETLEWPTKYARIFAQAPLRLRSGLLLYGYPGCGKTLLASAVAKECGLNFVGVKGPELLNKYIGASEASVRDLFDRASAARPCVLFFDEFDSIAPKRGHDSTGVTDRVVNQLLTQMDGAEGLEGVYVLAATSRPDLIDSALLRPGRLDKSVLCDMPSLEERADIFRALSHKVKLSDKVDLEALAEQTEGYSGADLQALLYNAHLDVVHETITASEATGANIRSRGSKTEGRVEYVVLGAKSTKTVRSKAEENALEARLQQIMSSRKETSTTLGTEKADDSIPAPPQRFVEERHVKKVLQTTKPSVSATERERLRRIYSAFIGDRSSKMPAPPDNESVGQRVTLM